MSFQISNKLVSNILTLGLIALIGLSAVPASTQTPGTPSHQAAADPLEPAPLPVHRVEGHRHSLDAMRAMPDSGEVVVKFREGLRMRLRAGVMTDLDRPESRSLSRALDGLNLDPGAIRRMFTLPEETLETMRSQGQDASGRALADMNNYYIVTVPPGSSAAQLADQLMRLPEVEFAEPAPTPAPPPSSRPALATPPTLAAPPPSTPDFTGLQGYAGLAPTGIGTRSLAGLSGINGSGIWVVDVEYSWLLNHEDLQLPANRVVNVGATPVDPFNDTNHGTAVMGQLVALDNDFGVTGIVPAARGMVAAANTTAGYNPAQAILAASAALIPGDVILIEQQFLVCGFTSNDRFGPLEWLQSVFDAVSTATANGRVVVAAAGNGNVDLDAPGCLNRFNRNVRDSGAIIVGAGSSANRSRLGFSSFGSRVDVQGWGNNVATTGYGFLFNPGNDPLRQYTGTFGGTSSASPIVSGAAIAIQGRLRACNQPRRTSVQMRTLLRNTGTPQTGGGGQIGPLPNVPAALSSLNIPNCPVPTTTVLTGPATSNSGQPATFTATVTAPMGPNPIGLVSFRRNGVQFGTANLNASGVAQLTTSSLPVGTHQITAVYLGSTGNAGSTSAPLTHTVRQPPLNDLFANRFALNHPPVTVTGTNVGATAQPGQPTIATANSTNAVWWSYTATSNAVLTIDTLGSGFDTTLAVFTGSVVNNLSQVAANDNCPGCNLRSRVQFQTVAGTQYQIAVAGFNNAAGAITLNLSYAEPGNNLFVNRTVFSAPGTRTGTNAGATSQTGQPTIATANSTNAVWWTFTPAQNGELTLDTFGSNFDTTLGVFTGSAVNALTQVAANNDCCTPGVRQSRVQFRAVAGTQYQIAVAGFANLIGNITLNLAFEPDQETTTTVSGPTSGVLGDTLSFFATVAAASGMPEGTVEFRRDGDVFGSGTLNNLGVASLSTDSLPEGTHQITARYVGADGFLASVSAPLPVTIIAGSMPDMQIAAGGFHSCGLDEDQQVWCWGRNAVGQLGDGTNDNRLEPVAVPGMNRVIQIAVGEVHSCALRDTGRVFCWGSNAFGQLGSGTVGTDRNTPVRMPLTAVTQISAGARHTCALRDTGRAFCWGSNDMGQLGDGSTTDSLTPVRVPLTDITQVAAGGTHSCALRGSERVFCWGANDMGQLGDGTTTDSLTPVRVLAVTSATQVETGGRHSCALRDTGRVFCWGHNGVGQLGDNTTTNRSRPVRVRAVTRVTQFSAGDRHNCALRDTGAARCWGAGGSGQLGNGATDNSPTPVAVSGMNRLIHVAAGGRHSCAARDSGRFFCWGNNGSGQLGDASTDQSSVPVRVR